MRDGNGFFAALSCALSSLCIYWLIAAVLILGRRGWDLGLFWFLAATVISAAVFELLLKKARPMALVTAVTLLLGGAYLAWFIVWTQVKLSFLHIFVMTVGAGMAVGMPLYGCLKRPGIHQHLSYLDVTLLTFMVLLLCGEYLGIGAETNVLFVLVLLMDAAAAVGLRMRGSGDRRAARMAVLSALGIAALLALAVTGLVALFSRSGGLTGRLLGALGSALQAAGGSLTRFFTWLTGLFWRPETFDTLDLPVATPSALVLEGTAQRELVIPPAVTAVLLSLVALAAIAAVVLFFRSIKTVGGSAAVAVAAGPARESRVSGALKARWAAFLKKLRFRMDALWGRNSAAGLLVWLERKAKKSHRERRRGESMREFIGRMAPDGCLSPLAEALDMEYYGGSKASLTPGQCRALRRAFAKCKAKGV